MMLSPCNTMPVVMLCKTLTCCSTLSNRDPGVLCRRQALAQAHGSLSPRSRGPRTAARRVDSGSVSAPPLIDTLLMTAAEQEALLRELQAQRALLAVASASSAATHAADGAATAADISTPKDALEARRHPSPTPCPSFHTTAPAVPLMLCV